MSMLLLFMATVFLAFWNGANDNFKGVATLYGSHTLSYRSALTLATLATMAGSLSALFLANALVANFSGKGLVPQLTAEAPSFLMAVAFGAAVTVLLATRLGFPISTTHSLVGGLLGAGLMAVGMDVNFARLGSAFFIPLLVSPLLALLSGALVYFIFSRLRKRAGLSKESCFCIGRKREYVPVAGVMAEPADALSMTLADREYCADVYTDKVFGIVLQKLLDLAHVCSAVVVSFARGLNDTPKIAGLLVASEAINLQYGMITIALAMALGGVINARKVAETMSHGITELNHGQGFSANLVTGLLVIFASKMGVPVSTTHVSVGAIFGIGIISRKRNANMIMAILLSWLITLPVAVLISACAYWLLV